MILRAKERQRRENKKHIHTSIIYKAVEWVQKKKIIMSPIRLRLSSRGETETAFRPDINKPKTGKRRRNKKTTNMLEFFLLGCHQRQCWCRTAVATNRHYYWLGGLDKNTVRRSSLLIFMLCVFFFFCHPMNVCVSFIPFIDGLEMTFFRACKKKKWTESTDREMHSYLVFHLKFHNCPFLSAFVRWANDILSFSLDFCIADVAVRVALHATRMLATVCMWYALYLFPWRTQFFFLVSFGNFMFFQSRPFFFFLCSLHWLLLLYFIFFFILPRFLPHGRNFFLHVCHHRWITNTCTENKMKWKKKSKKLTSTRLMLYKVDDIVYGMTAGGFFLYFCVGDVHQCRWCRRSFNVNGQSAFNIDDIILPHRNKYCTWFVYQEISIALQSRVDCCRHRL